MVISLAAAGMLTLSALGDAPVRGERPSLIADELASLRIQRPTLVAPAYLLGGGTVASLLGMGLLALAGRAGEASYIFLFGSLGFLVIGTGLLIAGTIVLIVKLTTQTRIDTRIRELESEPPRPPLSAYLPTR